jgi:ribonuclease D
MSYAANDVRLLITLAPVIVESLKQHKFYDKALEDCRAVFQIEPLLQSQIPYSAQQSELGKVQPHLQARLAQLFDWREAAIRMLNIPRKWLLSNDALFYICKLGDTGEPPKIQLIMTQIFRSEKKKQQLRIHEKSKDFFLQCLEIEELHDQFYLAWQELQPYPKELVPIRLGKKSKPLLETLEQLAKDEAQKRDIPHHAFIKRSWLKNLMLSHAQKKLGKKYSMPPILIGWREDFTTQIEKHLMTHWPYHI